MHVISVLRSAVAGPRRRPVGALAVLTVIVAVVAMHQMSGSPTSHHHGPHATSVVSAQSVPAAAQSTATGNAVAGVLASETGAAHIAVPAEPEGDCHDGCGGHDLATAMCLMILVALLALIVPTRRLLWRAPSEWSTSSLPTPVGVRVVAPPSLHELCISRT